MTTQIRRIAVVLGALLSFGWIATASALPLPSNTLFNFPGSTLGENFFGRPLGGVEQASFPAIWTVSQMGGLSYNASTHLYTFTISGQGNGIFDKNSSTSASSFFKIGNERFTVSFIFNRAGDLVGPGTLDVYGTLAAGSYNGYSWSAVTSPTLLWSASLGGQPGCNLASLSCKPEVDLLHSALGFYEYGFGGWFANQKNLNGVNPFTNGSPAEAFWLYTTCSTNTAACGSKAVSTMPTAGKAWAQNSTTNTAWNSFLRSIYLASNGNMIGSARNALAQTQFYGLASIAVVPLPASILLLLSGMGWLARYRRRGAAAAKA